MSNISTILNEKDDIQLMSRVLTIQTLGKDLKERKVIVSWDSDDIITPGLDYWSAAEHFNVAMLPEVANRLNSKGFLSIGYRLIDGLYKKQINWLPNIFGQEPIL